MKSITIFLLFLCSCAAEPTQDVKVALLELTIQVMAQKAELKNAEAEMAKMQTRLNDAENKIKELSKTTTGVAFTAALRPLQDDGSGFGKVGPFSTETKLIHQQVLTNLGRAYDSSTGEFTAPVAGVYFFTFTTYSWAAEANIGVKMMKNEEEVLLVWEYQGKGDNEDYASNSVVLDLEVGDKVYIRLPAGYQVAGSLYSNIHTFSGFLLFPKSV